MGNKKKLKKLPISACIIGYNEEDKVEECLKSVAPIVREIIFVDSYSTDKTVEIVKKYTSKIYRRKFTNYTEQKNFAIKKARFQWILSIDCDERLSPKLQEAIVEEWEKRKKEKYPPTAYLFPRLTFYIYKFIYHSGWFPNYQVRLFHKKYAFFSGEGLHEYVEVEYGYMRKIRYPILHYSFLSVEDHIQSIKRYAPMAAKILYQKGRKTHPIEILGRSFWVFLRKMFLEFAFLDGFAGFMISYLSSMATFCKYGELYALWQKEKKRGDMG